MSRVLNERPSVVFLHIGVNDVQHLPAAGLFTKLNDLINSSSAVAEVKQVVVSQLFPFPCLSASCNSTVCSVNSFLDFFHLKLQLTVNTGFTAVGFGILLVAVCMLAEECISIHKARLSPGEAYKVPYTYGAERN